MTEEETLLEFPCEFPIKVMGRADSNLDSIVYSIVRSHAPDIGEGAIRSRASRHGRYQAVTVTITARSRRQLDDIYRELTASEHVLMAL